ncbi:hypothetical protein Mp_4g04890 [Marchantia polymorpha subsp. ruderalis]|uniref:Uncharacterized protein n=2 Tax=Marchantia polymorpha TaxID=3197 RepID=A0AAF6B6G4_MARPO|nr:hypothetical protein MARPO_0150s0013 [Marchantia polymorpha]BBN07598.1 hypothetical protein Mp_4g04890 [Marchantia polymorpha subsp. ruderalis]|eukprot:PTQ28990.1 hypothetical protein MARPO_0150s0013 [Marchantia polymorpha]
MQDAAVFSVDLPETAPVKTCELSIASEASQSNMLNSVHHIVYARVSNVRNPYSSRVLTIAATSAVCILSYNLLKSIVQCSYSL